MRDLNTGASIIMIKATLEGEPEDNPQSSIKKTKPAQLINLLLSTLRVLDYLCCSWTRHSTSHFGEHHRLNVVKA